MTLEALQYAINRLINKRAELPLFCKEIDEINERLNKLYDLKYLMLQQSVKSEDGGNA